LKTFKDAIRHGGFAVSAEIFLRPESDAESIRQQATVLKGLVDGILITDNQYGQLHMSPLVAAGFLLDVGVDPIVQLTSRNRNRIALVSDLLGAGALGVTTLLLAAGERAPKGFEPRPKPVLDLKAIDLIQTAATIRADERLRKRPDFLIGGLVTPVSPGPKWKPAKLLEKIEAGAQFIQTHLCMNIGLLSRYMKRLVGDGLIHKTSVIVSLAVLQSADDARWLKENRPNVLIPDDLIDRMDKTANPRDEGVAICAEIIRELQDIPGIEGVSLMATRDLTAIPRALRAAGIRGGSE